MTDVTEPTVTHARWDDVAQESLNDHIVPNYTVTQNVFIDVEVHSIFIQALSVGTFFIVLFRFFALFRFFTFFDLPRDNVLTLMG